MKVMIIEPGPNNGTIGCGGSILKHIDKGNVVYMVPLTDGDAPNLEFNKSQFKIVRKDETQKAAEILGISPANIFFLSHKVFGINKEKAIQEIISLIRKLKPDVCYIPSPKGDHPDYVATNEIAKIALAFSGGRWFKEEVGDNDSWFVPTVLVYETIVPLAEPSYYEDITKYVEQKKEALKTHVSQTSSRRHDEASEHLNKFRGIMSGKKEMSREAFLVLRAEKVF